MMFTESSCICIACVSMCERSPCIPLPAEVEKLIAAGYKSRLIVRHFPLDDVSVIYPARRGDEGEKIQTDNISPCNFLIGGLCELHGQNLKPFEGRVQIHSIVNESVLRIIFDAWRTDAARQMVKDFCA